MVFDGSLQRSEYAQIIARAWADEGFKSRLLQDPAQVLREHGLSVPDNVELRAVENTSNVVHLVIPARPEEELSEEQLEKVSAGWCCCPDLFCW